MNNQLEAWQIPRRPKAPPPGRLEWLLYKLLVRIIAPLRRWYFRMETESQIKALKRVGSRPNINGPVKM